MSDTLATYAFLPWLRRGVASEITRIDGAPTGAPRADVLITLEIDAGSERRTVTVPLALHGPGEVAAIDHLVIVRTNPKPGEVDAEPNFFPAIEFDQADLPWRYTPARANDMMRLRPWIVLAVLTEDQIKDETPATGDGTLPALTVRGADALPRLSQSWAWAHMQVESFDAASESLDDVIKRMPHRARSRILAPLRLQPKKAYRAVLVPAFERGRRAGLREPLDDSVDGLEPAWAEDGSDIRIPIYYEWSFQTGTKGDFEFLARKLRARAVDRGVGLQDMDVSAPDPALPAASPEPLAFEGALMSPAAQSSPWPDAERSGFTTALSELLNRPAMALENEAGERTVAPPLWGRWHAARDRLVLSPAARPQWYHELNADPRLRVGAGLGAEIVRRNDQNLMAGAWDQIEGVLEANAELRRAQLARESAEKLYIKHYAKLDSDSFLAVTAPLQARFRASPTTFHEVLRRSPIPEGALDGQMRRVRRPAGPIAKRQGSRPGTAPPRLLERLNAGEVRARPPVPTPDAMMTPGKVLDRYRPPAWAKRGAIFLTVLAILLAVIAAAFFVFTALIFAAMALLGALATGIGALVLWRRVGRGERDVSVLEGAATPDAVRAISPPHEYVPGSSRESNDHIPVPPVNVVAGTAEAEAAVGRFGEAFVALAADLTAERLPGAVLVPVDIAAISGDLLAKMNPRLTISASITHRLRIADWVTWDFDDPLEPVMAAPEFDTPMYEPLRDYGQDWILPGVGRIPPDTVTLVVSNQRFIEAYMVGLSHEMGRELLYHEYPTDQRGTYFRQFWDVRGVVGEDGQARDPQTLRDIKPIHGWSANQGLGANSGQAPPPRDDHLVFLIKGELLRRYPSTLIYAIRTTIGDDGRPTLGEQKKYPVFEGRLEPDTAFFGFDLLPEEVRGDADPDQDQGWYFMLEEQSSDPIFGLDADDGRYAGQLTSVNDLSWSHLATDADALKSLGYIDLNAELPDTSLLAPGPGEPSVAWHAESGRGPAGANGSDLAYITLQRPFRVAIHGSDMLPPESAP